MVFPSIQIYLLGRFEVVHDQHILKAGDWSRRKAAMLLQYLTLERRLIKDRVIEALWPETSPEAGANSLYQTLHNLRQTLDTSLGAGCAESGAQFSRRDSQPR